MSSDVRHRVDSAGPFPLVRLAGVLDAGSAASVRSALLDVLAGQPEAVVVDVGELEVVDRDAVEVLRDLYRDTTDWPAARLVLCNPGDPVVWQAAEWPVLADEEKAFAQLGPPSVDHRVSVGMEPLVGAARRSRELINDACTRWGLEEVAGSACIVVTEMVNNVVQHAHTSMVVLLAPHDTDGLSVAVRDRSGTIPSYTGAPAPTSYGGRGMLLIDSVASRWGSLPLSDGKVVWALLAGSMTDPLRG